MIRINHIFFLLIVKSLVFVVVPLTVWSWIFENGFLRNAHKPRFLWVLNFSQIISTTCFIFILHQRHERIRHCGLYIYIFVFYSSFNLFWPMSSSAFDVCINYDTLDFLGLSSYPCASDIVLRIYNIIYYLIHYNTPTITKLVRLYLHSTAY